MIEGAVPTSGGSAPAATPAPQSAPNTNASPDAQPQQAPATGQATEAVVKPERPRAKVGEVEWEQDEDGEWYSVQKVLGKEERISHEAALRAARTEKASTERFQAAAAMEKQMEAMLATAASTPRATANFLAQLGVDVVAFAESILGEQIEASRLSPEQRRIRELEAERERWHQQEEARQRAEYERQAEAYNKRHREAYVQAFDQQLDALHAPKTQAARGVLHNRIAQLVRHAEDNGIVTDLPTLVKQAAREFQEMAGTKWSAPAPQPTAPKVTVPPLSAQPNSNALPRNPRTGEFLPRRDPKPQLIPGDASSVRAIAEWAKRNPGR